MNKYVLERTAGSFQFRIIQNDSGVRIASVWSVSIVWEKIYTS